MGLSDHGTSRGEVRDWSERVLEVDTVHLGEALGEKTRAVLENINSNR
jgi:hypothetical protein